MRRAGTGSWRFAHGIEQMPHALLYVRDALRLPVGAAPSVPPALSEVPPDRSELLEESVRARAAREWTVWWTTLIDHECRRHLDSDDDDASAIHRRFVDYGHAVHPETSIALVGTVLQPAAMAIVGDALDWSGRVPVDVEALPGLTAEPQAFVWPIVSDTVETAAKAHGVDSEVVDGAASVLLVQDQWWDLVAPRFALCSLAAATDPDVAGAILHRVFESGLTAA